MLENELKKRATKLLLKAAVKRIEKEIEIENSRLSSPDSPRVLLNVLNSGVIVDLKRVKKIALERARILLKSAK